jgi:hypothetical protein
VIAIILGDFTIFQADTQRHLSTKDPDSVSWHSVWYFLWARCFVGQIFPSSSVWRCQLFWARSKNCEKQLLASSCLSVCPSVRTEQLGSHWLDFHEIWYFSTFRKFVEKIQVQLKSDKNNGYCTSRHMYVYDNTSLNFSYNEKFSDRLCRGTQNTHCMLNIFFFENRDVYEIMWKHSVEPDRPQMTK